MKLSISPTLEVLKTLAKNYAYLPVYASFHADTETPVSVFRRFEEGSKNCFLLDSVDGGERWARYSFLAKDPLAVISSKNSLTTVKYRNGETEKIKGSPVEAVKEFMNRFKAPVIEELPRLYGGAVGCFSYDVIRYYEKLKNSPPDELNLPDLSFMIADEMVVFDHLKQKLILIVNIPSDGNLELEYIKAKERLLILYNLIKRPHFQTENKNEGFVLGEVKSNFEREKYKEAVEKAKKHIFDGDIFQIVLSQRFTTAVPPSLFDVYRALRITNPSPYMFYIKFEDFTLAGASPELLLRCENGILETCPIAGTRRRGETPEEDAALEKELLADEKEKSEHIMLVDLGRNDLGKVSQFGSVKVSEFMNIVRFSKVMHISSTVNGILKKGLSPFDALMSVFPAGTLSGAPKVRAMELIDKFEPTKRGIYGGAIGYMSFDGNLDSCITIRTILFKDGKAHIQAGAGIVADSNPDKEYEECVSKAGAMLNAIGEAGSIL